MLTVMGFVTIAVILLLLLTNRVAAVVALAGVPIVTALLAGSSPTDIGGFVTDGLAGVVGTTTMFVFAIVYFGVMRDAGLFDPIIRRIISFAGNGPVTVCLATAVLAMVAHLDGAGATTFLITIPAMLPLFDRLGMRRTVLTVCVGLSAGVMNVLPWGGPTARASTTSGVDVNDLWIPLIPAQVVGMVTVLVIAAFLGVREARRLGATGPQSMGQSVGQPAARSATPSTTEELEAVGARTRDTGAGHLTSGEGSARPTSHPATSPGSANASRAVSTGGSADVTDAEPGLRRPQLFWFNAALTVAVIAALVTTLAPPELIFVAAVVIALVVNYPGLQQQTSRLNAHAEGAMLMASTLLAAGVFLGILGGSGMVDAMASWAAGLVPSGAAPGLPVALGALGVPLSLLFGPDAFYFGVLPVLNGIGAEFGVHAGDLARASLLGEETVGFPISPLTGSFYLLVGLAGVDIGRHIRALIGWAWLVSLVMLVVAVLTGAVPAWAS